MEMSPRSHPALPVDLETLPEPDHPQAPGAGGSEYLFLTYTATPPISKTQHTFCRGPFQEKEGFLESGQGHRISFLLWPPCSHQASVNMRVPLWPVGAHLAPLPRVPERMPVGTRRQAGTLGN